MLNTLCCTDEQSIHWWFARPHSPRGPPELLWKDWKDHPYRAQVCRFAIYFFFPGDDAHISAVIQDWLWFCRKLSSLWSYTFIHVCDKEFDSREAADESVAKYNEGFFMGNKIRVELSHGRGRATRRTDDPGACFRCGETGHWAR